MTEVVTRAPARVLHLHRAGLLVIAMLASFLIPRPPDDEPVGEQVGDAPPIAKVD